MADTQARDLSKGYTVPDYLKPFVDRALESAPPLSSQQIDRIAAILRPAVPAAEPLRRAA